MTDLPQLQEALVGAAARRNRRARAASTLVGLGALAAVVAALATVGGTSDPELEVVATPVPASALTAREAADRFAVLRDESRLIAPTPGCELGEGPGKSYLVRRKAGYTFCVTVGRRDICIAASQGGGFGGGCIGGTKALTEFATARVGVQPTGRGKLLYAIVPDGTRDARVARRDGSVEPVPIKDNFLSVNAGKPVAEVSWTTPDGERFTSTP